MQCTVFSCKTDGHKTSISQDRSTVTSQIGGRVTGDDVGRITRGTATIAINTTSPDYERRSVLVSSGHKHARMASPTQ